MLGEGGRVLVIFVPKAENMPGKTADSKTLVPLEIWKYSVYTIPCVSYIFNNRKDKKDNLIWGGGGIMDMYSYMIHG